MEQTKTKKWRYYLKWGLWILLIQFLLANVSAAIYAYKFTHFYSQPQPEPHPGNFFQKTWKLFVGPRFYKDETEPAPSFPIDTVAFKTQTGIPIEAWYGHADSSKGIVIFVHGLSSNKSFLNAEASMIHSWDYDVLMIDLRAHGHSGGNNFTFGFDETEEVGEAFRFAKQHSKGPVVLYGVSLGATICLKAVAEKKVTPDAIIADVPFGTLHQHLQARARLLGFPSEPFATLVTTWIGWERGYNGFGHNTASYAEKISCPVLLEWGERDSYVSAAEIRSVFAALPGSKKKFEVYPDAGHQSFMQVDPNKWSVAVTSFLSGL